MHAGVGVDLGGDGAGVAAGLAVEKDDDPLLEDGLGCSCLLAGRLREKRGCPRKREQRHGGGEARTTDGMGPGGGEEEVALVLRAGAAFGGREPTAAPGRGLGGGHGGVGVGEFAEAGGHGGVHHGGEDIG